MKRIFRISATLVGAFALLTGFSSCSKDDDNNGVECCTATYTYDGVTYTYTACSDGTYSYVSSNGYSYSGKDSHISDNWSSYKSYILEDYGGSCS